MRNSGVTLSTIPGRQQPKPTKLKRIAKLKEQEIVSSACGAHATAIVSRDGKLFMFGSLEDDITEKSTGECQTVCCQGPSHPIVSLSSPSLHPHRCCDQFAGGTSEPGSHGSLPYLCANTAWHHLLLR